MLFEVYDVLAVQSACFYAFHNIKKKAADSLKIDSTDQYYDTLFFHQLRFAKGKQFQLKTTSLLLRALLMNMHFAALYQKKWKI